MHVKRYTRSSNVDTTWKGLTSASQAAVKLAVESMNKDMIEVKNETIRESRHNTNISRYAGANSQYCI